MEQFSFEKLDVYQLAMQLVTMVYKKTEKFPTNERYGLSSQIQRAIVSIPSNVAESCGRSSYKEKIHFIEFAYGSLLESYCQLQIAINLGYLTQEETVELCPLYFTVTKLLSGLKKSYEQKL